jgi:hypothetical protein
MRRLSVLLAPMAMPAMRTAAAPPPAAVAEDIVVSARAEAVVVLGVS